MKKANSLSQDALVLKGVADYYTKRLNEHGNSAKGVDWNSKESQLLRFETLSKILPEAGTFSIHDVGCGYGALYDYLQTVFDDFTYVGSDVSADMTLAAKKRLDGIDNVKFSNPGDIVQPLDFCIASGIFNVRLNNDITSWCEYFWSTLDRIDEQSKQGFAFNCLTNHSDKERMVDNLFYPDPAEVFDTCMKRYSKQVALLHDYGLYEFTILVRKS